MSTGFSRRRFVIASGLFAGYASAMEVENYRRLGLDRPFTHKAFDREVNGRSNMEIMDALNVAEDAQYNPCEEAFPGDDVPRGEVRQFPGWDQTDIFPGTVRDVSIYVPSQLTDANEPNVIVFNDGLAYADVTGAVRAPLVLDSLIHAGEIPPTVGVFVMPGRAVDADPAGPNPQRSFSNTTASRTTMCGSRSPNCCPSWRGRSGRSSRRIRGSA